MKIVSLLLLSACSAFASILNATGASITVPNKITTDKVFSIGSAGNHLQNQADNQYDPNNMVDGNLQTAWALPYKSGEVILQFNLKWQASSLKRVIIHNGY